MFCINILVTGILPQKDRLMKHCVSFLVSKGLLEQGQSESFFSSTPHVNTPWCIAAWIMNQQVTVSEQVSVVFIDLCIFHSRCDELSLDGSKKPSTQVRDSYSYAQKMRASMTYAFGRIHGLGSLPWHESESTPGHMVGNPSVSNTVSSFMISLRRRKVRNSYY